MFSIESVKKTNVPSGLYWPLQSYYHLCSWEIFKLRYNNITNSLASKVFTWIFLIVWVFKECIGTVVFCMRDYISRIRIRSILITFFWKLLIVLKSPESTKHVYNLRWRSIISKHEKSLISKKCSGQCSAYILYE